MDENEDSEADDEHDNIDYEINETDYVSCENGSYANAVSVAEYQPAQSGSLIRRYTVPRFHGGVSGKGSYTGHILYKTHFRMPRLI